MTLTELRYIVALTQEQHFGRAAERCHVSQPTLSIAVKKLEDELGVALFERSKPGILPTPLGRRIVAMASEVLERTARIKDVATADASGLGVTILPQTAAGTPLYAPDLLITRPFADPVPKRTLALAWRVSFPRQKAINLLRRAIQASSGAYWNYDTARERDGPVLQRCEREGDADEPKVIPFTTGHRREVWKHNCLSLGLASGFVEPLEATSIHLIARGMDFFLRYFPDRDCSTALIREYNRRMVADYEEVRDFIVLHYCATAREDSPFWQWCKHLTLPDSLQERIELFKAHGALREGVDELFRSSSWQSVFEGMGLKPAGYCPGVENIDYGQIAETLKTAKAAIQGMVGHLPTHDEYLRSQLAG